MRKPSSPRRQQGAVIVTVCLVLLFLLGFMAIGLDLGRLFVVRGELQTALDSCALAAAQELDGQSTAITRAQAAGVNAGNANRVNLQSANWDGQGQLTAANVTFLTSTLATTTTPAEAVYAECRHTQQGVRLWLRQAMGAFMGNSTTYGSTQGVTGRAVATRIPTQTTCPVPMVLVSSTTTDNFGLAVGAWITLVSGSPTNGYIGWANLDGSSSASEAVREFRDGQCNVREGTRLGSPGTMSTIRQEWNARFGIYTGSLRPDDAGYEPDTTGYAYTLTNWPTGNNAYDGATPAGAHATAQKYTSLVDTYVTCAGSTTSTTVNGPNGCEGITGISLPGGSRLVAGDVPSAGLRLGKTKRRLVLVPVATSYPNSEIKAYACMFMLHPMSGTSVQVSLEFLGNANLPGSPCRTSGVPGGTSGPLVSALVR